MASFVWIAPDRAVLQPNTSYGVRLTGEESKPEGTDHRITCHAAPALACDYLHVERIVTGLNLVFIRASIGAT
jgi:hypothetical protein